MYEIFPNQDLMEYWQHKMQAPPSARLHSQRHHVMVSRLTDTDAWQQRLTRAGFDPTQPTFWMTQGLVPCMQPAMLTKLLNRIDLLSAPGSQFVTEAAAGGDVEMEIYAHGGSSFVVHGELHYGDDGYIFKVSHGVL